MDPDPSSENGLSTTDQPLESRSFVLLPEDNERLLRLCGHLDEHLRQIESHFGVEINNRGHHFHVIGDLASIEAAARVLHELYAEAEKKAIDPPAVHLFLQQAWSGVGADGGATQLVEIRTRSGTIRARGANQSRYLNNIREHAINFGIGPAGTGKTYLAVAAAVEVLEREQVSRLILVRPAVEAGERLGFLPGDLAQKINPYLRPLYDALYEMIGYERVAMLLERDVIELAPLAYMRGRTLNDSFIILDEAQNTTVEQMQMFLTRIGFGSVAVINGDITQIDLPRGTRSGLRHAVEILEGIDGISFNFFNTGDVVRHPLVAKIVDAYDQAGESGDQS